MFTVPEIVFLCLFVGGVTTSLCTLSQTTRTQAFMTRLGLLIAFIGVVGLMCSIPPPPGFFDK